MSTRSQQITEELKFWVNLKSLVDSLPAGLLVIGLASILTFIDSYHTDRVVLAQARIAGSPANNLQFGNFGVPTGSERFFEEGRTRFEAEIQQLTQPAPDAALLLQIDPTIDELDIMPLEEPRLHPADVSTFTFSLAPHANVVVPAK